MKLETNKGVWGLRLVTWVILFALACGIVVASSFLLGPMLFSSDAVSRQVAVMVFCPGAVSTSEDQGASTSTTTSPSGTRGHTVEITCTMPDGSTQIIRNEQFALASIGGMFGGGALCGLGLSLPLFLVPFFLFRKKKDSQIPNQPSLG
ncbi:MAG: hypothetical protein HYZ25_06105 [Chloroflexi bacterium]|nr:hypothetical protein [Chloroflexota bacterium]